MIAGATGHDTKLLAATLAAVIGARPAPPPAARQHRCVDKASDHPTGAAAVAADGSTAPIRRIGEERVATDDRRHPPRRWLVERTLAGAGRSTCRARLGRSDNHAAHYRAVLNYACSLLWVRRYHRLAVLR